MYTVRFFAGAAHLVGRQTVQVSPGTVPVRPAPLLAETTAQESSPIAAHQSDPQFPDSDLESVAAGPRLVDLVYQAGITADSNLAPLARASTQTALTCQAATTTQAETAAPEMERFLTLLEVATFLVDGTVTAGQTLLAQLPESATIEVLPPFAGG